ncbi:alpha-L-rhamnosidase [Desertivirga xinjiangensis]|uniref:alpha-L-rhamnosidase n=1 Tax=Desertivirga xinjiangensis TaxID=539206 RepID=UPI00210CED98|nr:alpha-L-rhamnosidase [Pedobacter xinjiangensis]
MLNTASDKQGLRVGVKKIAFLILMVLSWVTQVRSQSNPLNLRCEFLENPIGIDEPSPRLTWNMADCKVGCSQAAFEVIVATDSAGLKSEKGRVWGSGKQSSAFMKLSLPDNLLKPFTRYFWLVRVWNKDNGSGSAVASFETGLLNSKNWKGAWITDANDIHKKEAPYFRKVFNALKVVKSARAYIAAAGLFELYLNGEKVGNHRLDPMFTRFDRRTLYLTHDVTSFIRNGQNAVGVLLGNGWFNHQSTAVWFFDRASWRARPKFCLDIRITYMDGSVETISSDNTWRTSSGPLVFNSIYTAEHYDARLEHPGWNTVSFVDTTWKNAIYTSAPSQNIVSQQVRPIRDVEQIKPVSFRKVSPNVYLFDLGRNISGVSEIKVKGIEGTTLRLIHAERLRKDGRADQSNIDYHYRPTDDKDPFQTDIFVLSGKKEDSFRARFNYKGFQYVEVVSDKPVVLTKESLTAYFMHSDVPAKGSIKSSSDVLNKIWLATNNSYLSNLFGYPTDCPQREKNGWTGDAHIAIETGLYNFDGITIYEKWLADHRDEQQPNGVLPAIIPTAIWGYDWANGPDWTSTIAIIPWNIYLFYGDERILSQNYENTKRYVDYINSRSPSGLTDWGLGDWIPIKSIANKELTTSIYFYLDASILAKSARVLGKQEDAKKYEALAEKVKQAINSKFLDRKTGIYCSGLQTELSAPLYWGIVPAELKSTVAKKLAERVERDQSIDVGLLGSKTVLNALSENGYAELAYKLASRETYPSWGWWIKNGATTLYENWKIEGSSDISLNHIMFGEISAWYYKALGGIFPDPSAPGFKHIVLKPNFVGGLKHFEAKHETPYGTLISAWKSQGKQLEYVVTIPPGSTASLSLSAQSVTGKKMNSGNTRLKFNDQEPGLFKVALASGRYIFSIKL